MPLPFVPVQRSLVSPGCTRVGGMGGQGGTGVAAVAGAREGEAAARGAAVVEYRRALYCAAAARPPWAGLAPRATAAATTALYLARSSAFGSRAKEAASAS
eukprot:5982142-Prymnesium_polylepis.1